MTRRLSMAALAVLLALPLSVGAQEMRMRVDRSTNASDPDDVPDVTLTPVGDDFRVGTGPAAVLWQDGNTASGDYTLSATFVLEEPSGHANYYGLIYGGSALDTDRQSYLYFLVAQNGTYIVKHRVDNQTVNDIQGRTPHDAIATPGDDGRSVNRLEVRVGSDQTEFVVNGTVVFTAPKSGAAARSDGVYGVRINHVIPSVLVQDLTVSR